MNIAEKLIEKTSNSPYPASCFIGFDGFTDDIIQAVLQRRSSDDYTPMEKMDQFGGRIIDFAGKSCNIELIVKQTKIGGNAPILTNALLKGGHRISFAGLIGTEEEIEPLFQEMADSCERVIPLGASGHTDALEFDDGKIILGKHQSLHNIDYPLIKDKIGLENLIEIMDESDLFVSANWTMLSNTTEIWKGLLEDVIPKIQRKKRHLFIDLADPAKKSDESIAEALSTLKEFEPTFHVTLGLNEAEAIRVGSVVGVSDSDLAQLAKKIKEKTGLQTIVIHARSYAVGEGTTSAKADGFYIEHPTISTGGGDNFNAGFLNALLLDMDLKECLESGVATSGFYVSKGYSPNFEELKGFINELS